MLIGLFLSSRFIGFFDCFSLLIPLIIDICDWYQWKALSRISITSTIMVSVNKHEEYFTFENISTLRLLICKVTKVICNLCLLTQRDNEEWRFCYETIVWRSLFREIHLTCRCESDSSYDPYAIKNQRKARNAPRMGYFVPKPLVGGFGCLELVLYGIRELA